MPILRVLKGRAPQKEYLVGQERAVLGRDLKSDIYLEQKDVSRSHAAFLKDGDIHYIIDLSSHNKTFLNGKELQSETPYELQNNDLIKVCNFIFAYLEDASDSWLDSQRADSGETVGLYDSTDQPGRTSNISKDLDSSSRSWESRVGINPEGKLRALMRVTGDLHDAMGVDEVLTRVLDSLLNIFPLAGSALVVIHNDQREGNPVPALLRMRDPKQPPPTINRNLVAKVMASQHGLMVTGGSSVAPSNELDECLMCVPLLELGGTSLGVIQLVASDPERGFEDGDLDLLSLVGRQLSYAIEDSRLHELALRQRTTQRDLELAREIQVGLLPSDSPRLKNYEFFDYYAPAREVGGDYYDYVGLPDNRLAVVVGDVSGKGVPAAMMMAKLSSEVRVYLTMNVPPVEVMNRVNESFPERAPEGSFVTMALLVLDLKSHEVEVVNAGHMRPLLRHGDKLSEVGGSVAGCPLGVIPEQTYQSCRQKFEQGDTLVMFSDGILDATNAADDLFEMHRLESLIEGSNDSAADLGPRILRSLHQFVGTQKQADDICLLCITRA